ncbi:MAG: hypothetical protein CM1200mP29_06590 [Verrucomicrobiota bacterium]|nr:MAG: hypothetical protein CM1200mP29_06590 [Verrucomicrobiota bacterium]
MPMVGMSIKRVIFSCDGRRNKLEHDTKCARLAKRLGVGEQRFALRPIAPLDAVAALIEHVLRQHAQVSEERNAVGVDSL